jgi:hypothetical protein
VARHMNKGLDIASDRATRIRNHSSWKGDEGAVASLVIQGTLVADCRGMVARGSAKKGCRDKVARPAWTGCGNIEGRNW